MSFILFTALAAGAAPVDFRRDVLPILSDACFQCHGPDEKAREAKLRLDQREGLFRTRNDVTVVQPGQPAQSELVLRVTSKDEDEVMPPRDAKRQLAPAEIETLRRWVAEGATWEGHWAFAPMARVTPPLSLKKNPQPLDAFVMARLEREKLTLSPEADRARLIRRVTLDLTGLPPTAAEVAAFESDRAPDAYEKLVDRLLASPRFGERMATEWLDVARYADTHGYQMDRPRAMWPWRDWVIQAFNKNLPYDQFVTFQLAGDLLPGATQEQRLATGFNRLHNQNEEGGVVGEEYRVAYVADRVTTFGTAFLGLTLECARCHDHKYDPISQKEFYSLFSFFQNIDEAGQISYAGFADSMPVPTLLLTTPQQDAELEQLRAQVKAATRDLDQVRSEAAGAPFSTWLGQKGGLPPNPAGMVARFEFDAIDDGKVANRVEPAKPGKAIEHPGLVAAGQRAGMVAELDGENGFTFAGVGHFKRTDAFSLALWLQPPASHAERSVVLHHSRAPVDAGSRGYEILLEGGRVAFALHYLWPGASLKIVTAEPIAAGEWSHVTVTYDGSSRAGGASIYVNGRPVVTEVVRDGLFKDITYAKTEPDLAVGYRFRDSGFKGGRVDDLSVFNRALTPLEAAQLAGRDELAAAWSASLENLTPEQLAGLFEYFLAHAHAPAQRAVAALQSARQAENALVMAAPEAMVMQELPKPKKAFVLQRGAYDAPGAEVMAGTPSALPAFPANAPRNRLGLAQWLLQPEHPLFARVTVNRFWQLMFGTGLVETSDNFGRQGTPPSHPELLDWLARDFVAGGWNVKALLRRMALSATYRQSSHASAALLARDPQNVLLARGPARRLTAEMLRDQVLAASGLLVEKVGGPAVRPYQPPGLWEEIAMGKPKYEQGQGDDLHRRSLYTFWKRTVPPPAFTIFDAADRNVCTVRRQATSTPLQALALLNDVQHIEAARRLGERMLREGGATRDAQLAWAFRVVCSRTATKDEIAILGLLFAGQHEIFSADADAAEKLLKSGEAQSDASLPAADRAAATIVAQALFNFDEALMRR
ncbi:MAG TPA: DUF1553 domain-containing protein [Opitutaceae bacterium]|nr:DUF1553 domain-containing protein [Opitutaceae bacterium]